MSRTILLVCLLVGCALSLPLLSVSKIQQRLSALDAADTCDKSPSYTCLGGKIIFIIIIILLYLTIYYYSWCHLCFY